MHELLTSRGFVRRADALDLAEVKEKEAAADAAAAAVRKERAEAAAKRRVDRGKATKLTQEEEAAMVRTTVVSVGLCMRVFVFAGSIQRVRGSFVKGQRQRYSRLLLSFELFVTSGPRVRAVILSLPLFWKRTRFGKVVSVGL